MEFVDFVGIRGILRHQHVTGAVVCLGKGAMRYSELSNAIMEWTGSRIGDGEVTRTVRRLLQSGLAKETYLDGHRRLTLTRAGCRRLDTIRALGHAFRHNGPSDTLHMNDDAQPGRRVARSDMRSRRG